MAAQKFCRSVLFCFFANSWKEREFALYKTSPSFAKLRQSLQPHHKSTGRFAYRDDETGYIIRDSLTEHVLLNS